MVSNQHADGRFGPDESLHTTQRRSPSAPSSSGDQRPSWAPPLTQDDQKSGSAPRGVVDAPFQQFYSTVEGLLSKLSTPLAFAGLPLTGSAASKTDAPTPTSPKAAKERKQPELSSSMDYSKLISKAALRAVNSNTSGGYSNNPSESFYVVPTAGGTLSYAEMINRADREEARTFRGHHRYTSNLSNISEDFVDARSTILPDRGNPSNATGNRRGTTNEPKVNGKTMEELALENETLRHVSDTLSRRLHVFEMSSQTSTAALAQSIRSLPRSPLATPEHSRKTPRSSNQDTSTEGGKDARIQELEAIMEKNGAKIRRRDDENAKLRETLGKYRDKWDNLKADAKARRAGQRDAMGRERSEDP